ncbi:MAG: hypothetical protein ACPGXY_03200 [Alphaproteobacteria bacterium]
MNNYLFQKLRATDLPYTAYVNKAGRDILKTFISNHRHIIYSGTSEQLDKLSTGSGDFDADGNIKLIIAGYQSLNGIPYTYTLNIAKHFHVTVEVPTHEELGRAILEGKATVIEVYESIGNQYLVDYQGFNLVVDYFDDVSTQEHTNRNDPLPAFPYSKEMLKEMGETYD